MGDFVPLTIHEELEYQSSYRETVLQQELTKSSHYLGIGFPRASKERGGSEDQIPPSIRGAELLHIPSKIESVIRDHIPESRLRKIHHDIPTARELVLIVASNLSTAYYHAEPNAWKALHSSILQTQVSSTPGSRTYRDILDLLKEGSKLKGPMIEEDERYHQGTRCRQFRLTPTYRNKGIKSYVLQTMEAKKLRRRSYQRIWRILLDSPIGKNMLDLYGRATTLTLEQVMEYGKLLAKRGYINKKGLILTIRGKKKWNDADKRVFVEDQVELYRVLTEGGYLMPIVSSEAGGFRVVDSFTLMPSWIRSMFDIDGEKTKEFDFSCLHPNIASTIFGGTGERISHQAIADHLGIPLQKAKKANLSFFNSPIEQMQASPVWRYYMEREPALIENLLRHREESGKTAKEKHKATSGVMLAKEVDLMNATIAKLSERGITTIYVYDALQGKKQDAETIRSIMNETAQEMGINTEAR